MERQTYEAPMTSVDDQGGIHRTEYASVSHLVWHALDSGFGRSAAGRGEAIDHIRECSGTSWVNRRTVEGIRHILGKPPADLVAAVDRARERLEAAIQPPEQRRRRRFNKLEDGDELDPIAWVQRRSDGWADTKTEYRPKPVVRIAVNIIASARDNAEHLLWRGATAAALADLLNAQGHAVEVVLFLSVKAPCVADRWHLLTCVIKPADAPLDVATLAVSLGDIAFMRLVGLTAVMRLCTSKPYGGLGRCDSLPTEDKQGFDVVLDYGVRDFDSALETVQSALAPKQS